MAKKKATKRKPAKKKTPGKRASTSSTSTPLTKVPSPPATLGQYGKAMWKRLAPQLVEQRILDDLHLESFEALCDLWNTYQVNKRYLGDDGDRWYFTTKSGYESESPAVRTMNNALAALQKLWPKFGLTPDSLKKIKKTGGESHARGGKLAKFARGKYED